VLLRHPPLCARLKGTDFIDAGRKELAFMETASRPLPRELRSRPDLASWVMLDKILRLPLIVQISGVEQIERRCSRIEIDIEPIDIAAADVRSDGAIQLRVATVAGRLPING